MDGSSTTGNPVTDVAVVVLLILIGGFFAASEIALITVRRSRLTQLTDDGNRAADIARRLTEDPSRFLALPGGADRRHPVPRRAGRRDRLRHRDARHRAGIDRRRRARPEDDGA